MSLHSPLEQFEINSLAWLCFWFYPIDNYVFINITTNFFAFFLVVCLITLPYNWSLQRAALIPSAYFFSVGELITKFSISLLRENAALKHKILFVFSPIVSFVFFVILSCNFIGMIPYSFTITSSLASTLAIALSLFVGINLVGISIHRFRFFTIFLPPGCPSVIAPFIVLVELVSYIARVLSLSIRLFANMMAGHTLLKILAGFAWQMISSGGAWILIGLIPVVIISAVCVLELAVSFLQTYVFCVLICLYIKDAAELH